MLFDQFNDNVLFVSDVVRAGKDHCVTNAKCIRDVGMAIAMEALGNVSVTLTGVAFYVIKVSHDQYQYEKCAID